MDIEKRVNPRNKQFFELYGQCQKRIFSFLFIMVHNEADAEDLFQDTAAAMLENFDSYTPGTNFTAWGLTIARNKAITFLRKNAKAFPCFNDDLYERIAEAETKDQDSFADRAAALEKCLNKLDSIDQKILNLRYEQDYSMKRIAELFGRSKTGLYHTLARIHNVLHQCVKITMAGQNIS
jgi:RNA polymerase sigma-70 factor, ECF subfamily